MALYKWDFGYKAPVSGQKYTIIIISRFSNFVKTLRHEMPQILRGWKITGNVCEVSAVKASNKRTSDSYRKSRMWSRISDVTISDVITSCAKTADFLLHDRRFCLGNIKWQINDYTYISETLRQMEGM